MTIELLYTSAAQGLKQGSRGFCTVVCTAGLPINLAQRLEALSGYRHIYQPGDQRDDANPVCYSHIRLTVGGKSLSILSRIAAYGVDYSQRTNKIAHHVVIDGPVPSCGPAAVLIQSGVMRTTWDGICKTLQNGPEVPPIEVQPAICEAWKRITGDSGWAGVVINAWLQPSSKPVWIIFSESQSQSLLELMQEAIAILPESRRWQATFSTYSTNLPPDVECRVRCVIAGSDEARMSIARGMVLDLSKPIGAAPGGESTDAARMGKQIGFSKGESIIGNESIITADDLEDEIESKLALQRLENSELHLENEVHRGPPIPLKSLRPGAKSKGVLKSSRGQSRNWQLVAIGTFVFVLILLLGYCGYALFSTNNPVANIVEESKVRLPDPAPAPISIPPQEQPAAPINNKSELITEKATVLEDLNTTIATDSKQKEVQANQLVEESTAPAIDSSASQAKPVETKVVSDLAKIKLEEILENNVNNPPVMYIEKSVTSLAQLSKNEKYNLQLRGKSLELSKDNKVISFAIPMKTNWMNKKFIGFSVPDGFKVPASANEWLWKVHKLLEDVEERKENLTKSTVGMNSLLSRGLRGYISGVDPANLSETLEELEQVLTWLNDLSLYQQLGNDLILKANEDLISDAAQDLDKEAKAKAQKQLSKMEKSFVSKLMESYARLENFRKRFGSEGKAQNAIPLVLQKKQEKHSSLNQIDLRSEINAFINDCNDRYIPTKVVLLRDALVSLLAHLQNKSGIEVNFESLEPIKVEKTNSNNKDLVVKVGTNAPPMQLKLKIVISDSKSVAIVRQKDSGDNASLRQSSGERP